MSRIQKTILVVAPYFPPQGGGLERYAYEIATRLAQTGGWRVVVVTTSQDGSATVASEDGLEVHRLPYQFKISNTAFSFGWFTSVRRILKQVDPEVVHIHMPVPGIGDIAALLAGNRRVVVTYHAGSMKKGKLLVDAAVRLYENVFLPLLLRRAEHITCSSDFVRLQFLRRYAYKSSTITPGVAANVFALMEHTKALAPTVLFVTAALDATGVHKGLKTLFAAMEKVQREIPQARLVVVGDGDMRGEYEEHAKKQLAEGSVTFRGRLFGAELARAYREAHVFALPTENDSYPITILEAMAAGLAVVSTNVGNIPLLVEESKTGFLVLPKDPDLLAERIKSLLLDPELLASMGEAAVQKSKEFSWDERARRYDQILEKKPPLIVQVSAYYPPHLGGIERVVQTMSERFAAEGWKVVVLTSRAQSRDKPSQVSMQRENLLLKPLYSFTFAHTPFAPTLLWHLLTLPRRAVVHLHLAQAYWPELVLLASSLRRTPYLVHFHLDVEASGVFGPIFLRYKKLLWGPILRNAHMVIACSAYHTDILVKKYGVRQERIRIIDNAVDESFFARQPHASPSEVLQLLSVGRLAPQKRVDRMIEAMVSVAVPAHLTIVGDGEERKTLEHLAQAKKLTNITFVGAKDTADIRAYHAASDLFLISSEQEGAPLALLEAMAGGLPVIGTNVPGIRNLVDGVGMLVEEPYPTSLARAVNALVSDKLRLQKMSAESRARAAGFTFASYMEKIHQVYHAFPI